MVTKSHFDSMYSGPCVDMSGVLKEQSATAVAKNGGHVNIQVNWKTR
jgi:hypothetical protein